MPFSPPSATKLAAAAPQYDTSQIIVGKARPRVLESTSKLCKEVKSSTRIRLWKKQPSQRSEELYLYKRKALAKELFSCSCSPALFEFISKGGSLVSLKKAFAKLDCQFWEVHFGKWKSVNFVHT